MSLSITGPDFNSLPARNFERAAAFYDPALGLHRIPSSTPDEAIFATTPIPLRVKEYTLSIPQQVAAEVPSDAPGVWLYNSNPRNLHGVLITNNALIHRTSADGRFGKELTFSHTEGKVITVHERR